MHLHSKYNFSLISDEDQLIFDQKQRNYYEVEDVRF